MARRKAGMAKIEVRRVQVAEKLLAGKTYRQIAVELNPPVSLRTVFKDVQVILERWRKEAVQDVAEHQRLDLRRIDEALAAIHDQIKDGQFGAIDRLVKLLERRAKMLGYDAPENVVIKQTRNAAEMTDEELAAIAANGDAGRRGG